MIVLSNTLVVHVSEFSDPGGYDRERAGGMTPIPAHAVISDITGAILVQLEPSDLDSDVVEDITADYICERALDILFENGESRDSIEPDNGWGTPDGERVEIIWRVDEKDVVKRQVVLSVEDFKY